MASPTAADAAISVRDAVEGLTEARERTLALVSSLSDDALERVHSTLMSPLVWDLGHIAAFEDLWLVHRFGVRPLLRDDLADVYDAFETPRASRGELPFLRPAAARDYLADVRERTLEVIDQLGVGDGVTHEMVIRHEMQHCETMLQTIQLGRLAPYAWNRLAPIPLRDRVPTSSALAANSRAATSPGPLTGLELVTIPAGTCTIGAPADGFAYDNERARHPLLLGAFQIGRAPVTNATYLTFVEGGGYERREWWSDEGWAWKEQYDITRPAGWTADCRTEWRLGELVPLAGDRPVIHVSWFEAEAFARAHDARLPTEYEWEKAATWDQEREHARRFPWGSATPIPGVHANVDHYASGPVAATAFPAGASPYGCLSMIGDVWEWTSSPFTGYPGFTAFPYPEYSEVFFGEEYRVLRGGSWATRARVISPTFRNWDYPQRRQIFAGFRIARD